MENLEELSTVGDKSKTKKIGIITLYMNSCNYGGLLQAYALEKYLINYGYDAKQICYGVSREDSKDFRSNYIRRQIEIEGIIKCFIQILRSSWHIVCDRIANMVTRFSHAYDCITIRKNAVKDFRENCIAHTEKIYDGKSIYLCNEFDVYICGSDQIWHGISKYGNLNDGFWLKFVKEDKIKISYAASISLPGIPKQAEKYICEALKGFKAISVRENNDKKVIQRIVKDKVECVLDPTLLIDREEWDKLSRETVISNREYIFAYLIGGSDLDRNFVTEFGKKMNIHIVTIPYLTDSYRKCDKKFGDDQICNLSPTDWISLIKNAKYIFTDSFHGCVFSILFHKDFYTFKRFKDSEKTSMNSRIYSLFDLFEIEDRLISNDSSVDLIRNISRIDYNKIECILQRERNKAYKFLYNAIENNKDE